MICCGVIPVGGAGSRGPNPAASCAAAPSGIATAAKAGVGGADSCRREKARRLAEAVARIGKGFIRRTPLVQVGLSFLRCPARYKNRRDLRRFGDVVGSEGDGHADRVALAGDGGSGRSGWRVVVAGDSLASPCGGMA